MEVFFMWSSSELKTNAKAALKRFGYWTAFLVTLVAGFFTESLFSGASNTSGSVPSGSSADTSSAGTDAFAEEFPAIFEGPFEAIIGILILLFIFIFIMAFSFGWAAFLGGPVAVGRNRFFMEHSTYGSKFSRLFWAFSSGNYLNIVKTMFFYEVKIFLWTLLFIIPGIIKQYEYFMVPYIMAENPNMSTKRAFEISKLTTKGEKADILVLELTFIGWIILGMLTCGIGMLFLEPYYRATYAELYHVLREKAIGLGYATPNELPGFYPYNT